MSEGFDWIGDVLSEARFAPYLAKAGGDEALALEWYWWNVAASTAFYPSLHCLEVALRNAVHRQLVRRFGRDDWWESVSLSVNGERMVQDAHQKLSRRSRAHTADHVVAELSFGFWVSFISGAYDRQLWVPCLHKAFPRYRGSRKRLHKELHTMLLFRNRIMHHEPIHHRHLGEDHRTILRILSYFCAELATQLQPRDQVSVVLGQRPRLP